MGAYPQPLFVSLDFLGSKGRCNSSGPVYLEPKAKRRCRVGRIRKVNGIKGLIKNKSSRRILLKRREGSRRPTNQMERKVRTLKKLIPNCTESTGLDGLFRETADYILALQMRVKVMQTMVNVLSASEDE